MSKEPRGNITPSDGRGATVGTQEEPLPQTKPFEIPKRDVMRAFRLVETNRGAAGIDKVTLEAFKSDLKNNLYKIWNRMSSGSYFPPPVKGVEIPKKSGGNRVLGVPTVSDRVAQMVAKLHLEPLVEPIFLDDSYGYRPGKSALGAVGVTRKRCWKYDWVVEFDIVGLFDNIPHDLLMKAVEKHCDIRWVVLYIKRWLTVPLSQAGALQERTKGTPQGGVLSPVLSNLFLHYVFDKWMTLHYPELEWCRYADDGLVHCKTEEEAHQILDMLRERFLECGLELHPTKTKIVYCKDDKRKGEYSSTSFDFLGYTFQKRQVCRPGSMPFMGFNPAVSKKALKAMSQHLRNFRIRSRTELTLPQIASRINPVVRGWINYYGSFYRSALSRIATCINRSLIRYVQRKYKKLSHRQTAASRFIKDIAAKNPQLFAHWKAGIVGQFA